MQKIPWTLDNFEYWVGDELTGHVRSSEYHIFIPDDMNLWQERQDEQFITGNTSLCGDYVLSQSEFFDEDEGTCCFSDIRTWRPENISTRDNICKACQKEFIKRREEFE